MNTVTYLMFFVATLATTLTAPAVPTNVAGEQNTTVRTAHVALRPEVVYSTSTIMTTPQTAGK